MTRAKIAPASSFEVLVGKQKLSYFGHIMGRKEHYRSEEKRAPNNRMSGQSERNDTAGIAKTMINDGIIKRKKPTCNICSEINPEPPSYHSIITNQDNKTL